MAIKTTQSQLFSLCGRFLHAGFTSIASAQMLAATPPYHAEWLVIAYMVYNISVMPCTVWPATVYTNHVALLLLVVFYADDSLDAVPSLLVTETSACIYTAFEFAKYLDWAKTARILRGIAQVAFVLLCIVWIAYSTWLWSFRLPFAVSLFSHGITFCRMNISIADKVKLLVGCGLCLALWAHNHMPVAKAAIAGVLYHNLK